ncbi:uncharacterized protein LOC123879013 [Maniola jurtina]|uniref:uncharacterized protein LOC123879013 n=1 Tax=Maniola jurtina TaxID=191418 RepID=UPI001E68DCAF|nr:uncharacterized protein LOC123879013 [Maniola jurtina]
MICQNAKMADKKVFILFLICFNSFHIVNSASLFERSYEYVMNFGRNVGPSLMSILDCFGENGGDSWVCAREKAGKLLDSWDKEVDKQRMIWAEAADAEVVSSGRSFEELPSRLGKDIQLSLTAFTDLVENGMARAMARKKDSDSGGIDTITISTSDGGKKKKMKKKKQKPAKIQLIQPVMMPVNKMEEKGPTRVQSWVIGDLEGDSSRIRGQKEYRSTEVTEKSISGVVKDENDTSSHISELKGYNGVTGEKGRKGRGILTQMWGIGEKALDAVAEHALESENAENGLVDRSSIAEQRGKKKKKKKAILKLLILGAVLKAKIGTLLQILSFKLQVKFFIIALIGLGINLARFLIELKNKHHHQQPQKVIYYEHAQHQHHYDHEDEEHGWGPWSRSIEPEEVEAELEEHINSPYRGHQKIAQVYPTRPLLTLS